MSVKVEVFFVVRRHVLSHRLGHIWKPEVTHGAADVALVGDVHLDVDGPQVQMSHDS